MGFFSHMIGSAYWTSVQTAAEGIRSNAAQSSDGLRCIIKAERSIDDLASTRSAFSVLPDYRPHKKHATAWNRKHGESHDLMVVALGKTGYGKSTTLNSLLREEAFETSDISGCTRKLQSLEYRFDSTDGQYFCSFADLPGLGERPELDLEYYPLYRKTLATAHVILYFVRADQRDYSVDQRAFEELITGASANGKVILVINAIDKIEPLNRSLPFVPSGEQQRALDQKVAALSGLFSLPRSSIIAVSGTENYHLDELANMIVLRLGPSLVRT